MLGLVASRSLEVEEDSPGIIRLVSPAAAAAVAGMNKYRPSLLCGREMGLRGWKSGWTSPTDLSLAKSVPICTGLDLCSRLGRREMEWGRGFVEGPDRRAVVQGCSDAGGKDEVEDMDSRSSATGLSTVTMRFVGDFFHIPNLEFISR